MYEMCDECIYNCIQKVYIFKYFFHFLCLQSNGPFIHGQWFSFFTHLFWYMHSIFCLLVKLLYTIFPLKDKKRSACIKNKSVKIISFIRVKKLFPFPKKKIVKYKAAIGSLYFETFHSKNLISFLSGRLAF